MNNNYLMAIVSTIACAFLSNIYASNTSYSPSAIYNPDRPKEVLFYNTCSYKSVLNLEDPKYIASYKKLTRRHFQPHAEPLELYGYQQGIPYYEDSVVVLIQNFFNNATTHEDITLYRIICAWPEESPRRHAALRTLCRRLTGKDYFEASNDYQPAYCPSLQEFANTSITKNILHLENPQLPKYYTVLQILSHIYSNKSVMDLEKEKSLEAYKKLTRRHFQPSIEPLNPNNKLGKTAYYSYEVASLIIEFLDQAVTRADITLYRILCAWPENSRRRENALSEFYKKLSV